jgi:hypothetical protein
VKLAARTRRQAALKRRETALNNELKNEHRIHSAAKRRRSDVGRSSRNLKGISPDDPDKDQERRNQSKQGQQEIRSPFSRRRE